MAGDTSQVCIETLRVQWSSHSSYAAICTHWTITKDQLVRLRNVVPLPLRLDRRLRHRPSSTGLTITSEELAASESSLDLAPMVAARATCVTVHWTDEIRSSRQVTKPEGFRLPEVGLSSELRDAVEREPG